MDSNGQYRAGSAIAQVVDTITVTDRNDDGGRACADVTVLPMIVSANPAAVAQGDTATVTAQRGVTPFSFAITNR